MGGGGGDKCRGGVLTLSSRIPVIAGDGDWGGGGRESE